MAEHIFIIDSSFAAVWRGIQVGNANPFGTP